MSDDHNAYQRRYYTERPLPRLSPELSDTPYVRNQVRAVVTSLDLAPGAMVLDVGCGLGKYTIALADLGIRVEGLDLTPELIEDLRKRRPDIPGYVGDAATPLPELAGRFDAAIGFFFLHHVDNLSGVFTSLHATLRPRGKLAFLEPNPYFPGYYAQIAFTRGMTWRGERGILRMRPGTVRKAADASDLRLTEHGAFGAVPPAVANRTWGQAIERVAERLPMWDRVGAFRLLILE